MRKFSRIVDQIVEYLLNFAHVSGNEQFLSGQYQVEGQALLIAGSLEGQDGGLDDPVDVEIRDVQQNAVSAEFIQINQTLGQLV